MMIWLWLLLGCNFLFLASLRLLHDALNENQYARAAWFAGLCLLNLVWITGIFNKILEGK